MMKKYIILGLLVLLLVSIVSALDSRGGIQVTKSLDRESDTSSITKSPLLWVSVGLSFFYFMTVKTLKAKKKRIMQVILIASWIITFAVIGVATNVDEPTIKNPIPTTNWQEDYQQKLADEREGDVSSSYSSDKYITSFVKDPNAEPSLYLAETEMYDYSNLEPVINSLLAQADSADEAVQLALDWVYYNMDYVSGESDSRCFDLSASELVQEKYKGGQCDTQSRVVISLLRGMGIAARPVGGCISRNPSCNFQFALMSLAGKEIRRPQFAKLEESDLMSDGVTSRKGGLHLWGEVWLPDEGWVTFESTSGSIVDNYCWNYLVELYPSDEDTYQYCVSTDRDFQLKCINW